MKSDISNSNDNPGQIQIHQLVAVDQLSFSQHSIQLFFTNMVHDIASTFYDIVSNDIIGTYSSSRFLISGDKQN